MIKRQFLLLLILSFSFIISIAESKNIEMPCSGFNCTILLDKIKELAKYQVYNTFEISGDLVHTKVRIDYYVTPTSSMCRRMISSDDIRIFDVYIFKNNQQIAFEPYLDTTIDENGTNIVDFPCYKAKANDTIVIDFYVGGKVKPDNISFLNLTRSEILYPFDKYSFTSWSALDNVYYNRIDKLILPPSFVPVEDEMGDSCPCAIKMGLVTQNFNLTTNKTVETPLFYLSIYSDWFVFEGGGEGNFITEDNKRVVIWPILTSGTSDEMKKINPWRYNFSADNWDNIYDYRTGCYLTASFERTMIIKYFFFVSLGLISASSIYFIWFYKNNKTTDWTRLYKTFGTSFVIWSFQEGLSSLTPLVRPTTITLFDTTLLVPLIFFVIYKSQVIDFFKKKSFLKWNKLDYAIFFLIIPLILVIIYLLPQTIKNSFILLPTKATITNMFFSNYTHTSFSHLMNNLIGYFIIIFLIFHVETNKRIFYISSFLIFILLPLLSSLLVITIIPKIPPALGFSAIVYSFFGYLLYSVYKFVNKSYKISVDYKFLLLLLMINILIFSIFSVQIMLLITASIIAVFLIYINRKVIKEISKQMILNWRMLPNQKFIERLYSIAIFSLVIVFMFSFTTAIPSKIVVENSIINIFSHYIGYMFGLFVPWAISIVKFKKKIP